MKKLATISVLLLISIFVLSGCGAQAPTQSNNQAPVETSYEDGTYRGAFLDGGEMQVNVQFTLEDNVVTEARYRYLAYNGTDYLSSDDTDIEALKGQYEQAIDYLIGKDIRDSLQDLYEPDFVDDVDAFSGATIRANKVISASRDALNRGVYSY